MNEGGPIAILNIPNSVFSAYRYYSTDEPWIAQRWRLARDNSDAPQLQGSRGQGCAEGF